MNTLSAQKALEANPSWRALQEALRGGRLAQAYLLVGPPEGIIPQVVQTLAQTLLCETPALEGPCIHACGTCPACRQVLQGNHPSFQVLSPEEGEIRIQQVRELQRDLALRTARGQWKIYWIREAERFTLQAANAFLKALEEPPPRTLFLLQTRQVFRVLPTIRSRCQRLDVEGASAGILPDFPEVEAFRTHLQSGFRDIPGWMTLVERLASRREDLEAFLQFLQGGLRDALVLQHTQDPGLLLYPPWQSEWEALGRRVSSDRLLDTLQRIRQIQRGLEVHVNPRLALECLFWSLV